MESIYDIIPVQYSDSYKQSRHVSKFKANGRNHGNGGPGGTNAKSDRKTMGPAKVQTRKPDDFLKKQEKQKVPEKSDKKFAYSEESRRKAPVPSKDDRPIMGLKSNKDFIKNNAVEAIMSVPGKPERNYADTKKGDTHLLETSGLEPKYVHKKEYGETPEYIERRKAELQRAQDDYDSYVTDHNRRGAMKKLSQQERFDIVNGLKANWELVHHDYQALSVVTDNIQKKNRKERMESEMKQLEKDIESIQRHQIIYVAN